MTLRSRLVTVSLAVGVVVMGPLAGRAQSSLTAAEVAPFLGTWTLNLETPQGAVGIDLSVLDRDGTITGTMSNEMIGEQSTSDVRKSESGLVLRYTLDFQGNPVPIEITLTPDAEKADALKFVFDAAGGQFFLEGQATKK